MRCETAVNDPEGKLPNDYAPVMRGQDSPVWQTVSFRPFDVYVLRTLQQNERFETKRIRPLISQPVFPLAVIGWYNTGYRANIRRNAADLYDLASVTTDPLIWLFHIERITLETFETNVVLAAFPTGPVSLLQAAAMRRSTRTWRRATGAWYRCSSL